MPNKPFEQLSKLRQNKRLMFALILTLVAVFFWLVASIASTKKEQAVSPELIELAKSLVPTLDKAVFDSVEKKGYFEENELKNFSIFVVSEVEAGSWQIIDVVNQQKATILSEEEAATFNQANVEGGLTELKNNQPSGESEVTE